ncbi:MAG: tetratricopeptide repeat protein [Rhizobiales bacterium]|nr:tetratricopeptide repeat protein [Hyphomicrobiales bacterium]
MSRPDDHRAVLERAHRLHQAGDWRAALEACAPLTGAARPDADALLLAGIIRLEQGETDQGLGLMRAASKARPADPTIALNLGVAYRRLGRGEDAVAVLKEALGRAPRDLGLIINLAQAQLLSRDFAGAERLITKGLKFYPNHGALLLLYVRLMRDQGLLKEAEMLALNCRTAFPGAPDFEVELAELDLLNGRAKEALARVRPILMRDAGFVPALVAAASAHAKLKNYEELIGCRDRIPLSDPMRVMVDELCVTGELAGCEWQAMNRRLTEPAGLGQITLERAPFIIAHLTDDPVAVLTAANCLLTGEPSRPPRRPGAGKASAEAKARSGAKLRVGYLSSDFNIHPVGFLLTDLIDRHDRTGFEIIGLSLGLDDKSHLRRHYEQSFDRFVDLAGKTLDQAITEIKALELDILVDLNGHTAGRSGGISTAYAAPIQVTWLGYPGTFGGAVFDYTIADPYTVPDPDLPQFSEKVARLPDTYQCNVPRVASGREVTRADCGLPEDAFVFCSFNDPRKITRPMVALWCRILRDVPDSVFWLNVTNRLAEVNIRRAAAEEGVAADRFIFAPALPFADHFQRLTLGDLFLDTFPYSGHTTCSDALAMGLPVLALPGRGMGSRVAASLVTLHGFPELVAADAEDYVAKAKAYAADRAGSAELKRRIKAAVPTSKLYDSNRFARHMEQAFITMVEIHRSGEPPRSFDVAPLPAA